MMSRNSLALVVGLFLVPCVLSAQRPAGAPAGTSGKCKDGTFTSAATKQGACRGHQGVDTWFAAAAAPTAAPAPVQAPAPKAAAAPTAANSAAGATGKCKDGTFTSAATKQGACRGHQGIDTWFAAAAAPAAAPVATPAAAPAPKYTPPPVAAPAPVQAPAPAPARAPARASTSDKTPAPGGGPGLVWVNSSSNVYHCYGTQWYGTTKAGKYMSESQATASGARADHGKPCSK